MRDSAMSPPASGYVSPAASGAFASPSKSGPFRPAPSLSGELDELPGPSASAQFAPAEEAGEGDEPAFSGSFEPVADYAEAPEPGLEVAIAPTPVPEPASAPEPSPRLGLEFDAEGTDDPLHGQAPITTFQKGEEVTLLAFMGEDWAYVQTGLEGRVCRLFIPRDALLED